MNFVLIWKKTKPINMREKQLRSRHKKKYLKCICFFVLLPVLHLFPTCIVPLGQLVRHSYGLISVATIPNKINLAKINQHGLN